MILVARPEKKFSFNAKGVPQRTVILKSYEQEIEVLYEAFKARHVWPSTAPIVCL